MGYGYSFLQGNDVPNEGGKMIREMDMTELRAYLCAKTLGDPKTCISCTGFKGCQVGQRALVLMGQQAKEKARQRSEQANQAEVPAVKVSSKPGTQDDKDDFRKACESGNARRWLQEHGYSDAAAQEKLVFWTKHYPDITKQYGKKRIMQKMRKVVIKSVETEQKTAGESEQPINAAKMAHKGEQLEQEGEILSEKQTAPEGPKKAQKSEQKGKWSQEALEHARKSREKAVRERCLKALETGDPEGYMVSQGITRKAARQNLRRWQEKFPDLFLDEKGPEETAPEPDSIIAQKEDEISLADFLRQYGVPILSETPEPVVEQKDEPEENPNRELARLMEQEAKLLEQVADLQGQIWEIRAKRRKIEEKMSH